jgi:hypothetical protein
VRATRLVTPATRGLPAFFLGHAAVM